MLFTPILASSLFNYKYIPRFIFILFIYEKTQIVRQNISGNRCAFKGAPGGRVLRKLI